MAGLVKTELYLAQPLRWLDQLSALLARELAPNGIRVNAVCPGFVKTGMQSREIEWESRLRNASAQQVVDDYLAQTPLGRLGRVSDIAPLAVFLASDEPAWITGEVIRAAGGLVVAT